METIVSPVRNRTSWGAIFAGVFVALGLMMLLVMLGLAVGLGAIDPQAQNPFGGIGIGSAIWLFVSAFLSLLAGGFVTGRLSNIVKKSDGGLNGAVVWALVLMLSVFLTGQGLAGIVGGVTSMIQQGASVASSGADRGLVEDILRQSGLTEGEEAVQTTEVPQQAQPPQEQQPGPQQPQPAGEQGLSQEDAAQILAENTGLTQEEARNVIRQGQQTLGGIDIGEQARGAGEAAASYSSAALWIAFFLFAVMLAASIIGGALGVTSKGRERVTV